MSNPVPSILEALVDYRIAPDNLWVLFFACSQGRSRSSVEQPLFLADPGEKGRHQIENIEKQSPHYLGCFSFLELAAARGKLDEQPVLEAPAHGLGKLLPAQIYFIPVSFGKEITIHQVRATSLKDAVTLISQLHPGCQVGFGGLREDVESLLNRMEQVICEQDFCSIETDRRGPIKTWDADRLLYAKHNPSRLSYQDPYPDQKDW